MHTPFLVNLNILVVDNDVEQRELLCDFCHNHGGKYYSSRNVSRAIDLIEYNQFDVALCEIFLNGDGSGFDLLKQIKIIDPDLTVILVTAKTREHLIEKIIQENVYALLMKPYVLFSLGLMLLQASRNTKERRKNSYIARNLKLKIDSVSDEKNKIFINTLSSLSAALDQKDEYTKDHSEEVGKISEKICNIYNGTGEFAKLVSTAGRLHDIGKIGIKDEILLKQGKLTAEEFAIIRTHPENSYKIVKPVDRTGRISEYVLHHHERWDGNGYPHKLKEKEIPSGSRILAVADAFNALTSNRPYREAKNLDYALDMILKGKGSHFDPDIVDILYELICNGEVTIKDWDKKKVIIPSPLIS